MKKKAMFFSLMTVLLILFLFVLFASKAEISKLDEEFRVNRAQVKVMDHFARDFERYYLNQILKTSAQQTLAARTNKKPFSATTKSEIADIMVDGKASGIEYIKSISASNEIFGQALKTLSFKVDEWHFVYRLDSVKQVSFDTIQLEFLVDYRFKVFSMEWSKSNKPIIIQLKVYSMWHPSHNNRILQNWKPSESGCYANEIIYDSEICNGMNIKPPEET